MARSRRRNRSGVSFQATVIQVPAGFAAVRVSNFAHCGTIRAKPIGHHNLRTAIPFHGFSHEFQCGSLIARLRDEGLQDFAFMVDGTPKVVSLPTDFHKHLIQMPLPLWRMSHSFRSVLANLVREVSPEPIHPVADRFMANIDPALVK